MQLWDRLMATIKNHMPGTEGGLQEWLDGAADMGGDRCHDYRLYHDFYTGNKGAELRDRARQYLELNGVPFTENFCDVVVDTMAERLRVIGFSGPADTAAGEAEEWWRLNRMDGVQQVVHAGCLIRGDEFVIVDWDDVRGAPRFTRQQPHHVKIVYDDDQPDRIMYATKVWNTRRVGQLNPKGRAIRRLNVYWPDRVEKWYRPDSGGDAGAWERWQDDDDLGWPVWWTITGDEMGDPLGVPVVHFRHRPDGTGQGRSRIRQVIPFQAELNKYLADLSDLVDNHALPQDWVKGVAGDNVTFKRVPGNMWQATSADAEFGRLEASPADNLLAVIEGVLSRMARKTRTPMHLLTGGTPPSGESLKTAESGLIASVEAAQVGLGNSWEDMIGLGFRLASVFADIPMLPEDVLIETQWANPATRSDKDELETATLKKQLGVSKRTLLQELGYDPEAEEELRRAENDEAQAAMAGLLNSGVDG